MPRELSTGRSFVRVKTTDHIPFPAQRMAHGNAL